MINHSQQMVVFRWSLPWCLLFVAQLVRSLFAGALAWVVIVGVKTALELAKAELVKLQEEFSRQYVGPVPHG